MEKLGFFTTDTSEAVQAIEEQVFKKKLMGGAAGLELCQAEQNIGLGPGLRRTKGANRMDIPTMWRALIRPPHGKSGPVVSLLAPRGQSAARCRAKAHGRWRRGPGHGRRRRNLRLHVRARHTDRVTRDVCDRRRQRDAGTARR